MLAQMHSAAAHTVSIGYTFVGPGAVDIWYGSYHGSATYTEADLQLVGPSFNSTVAFTMTSALKPTGLVDGVNNFFSNTAGTALVGAPEVVASTDGSGGNYNPPGQLIVNWQGVNFTGLRPGTYTFTYNPLGIPTVEWHPINDVIRTNTFTLSAADILGIPGYRFYGTNINQRAVGRGLDTAIGAGGFNQPIYNIALMPPAQMAQALTMISGEVATQGPAATFQPGDVFLATMLDPFAGSARGGNFGGGSFGYSSSPHGSSPYGNGGYGTPYDPYGPNANQQYGDPRYGYGGGNGNTYYDPYAPNPNGPNANSPYGTARYNDPRSGNPFQRQVFENHWSLWQTTYGGRSTANGDDVIGSHNTEIGIGGLIAGADYRTPNGGVIGAAIAGGMTSWVLSDSLGSGTAESVQAGFYASQRFGNAYLSAAAAIGRHELATERNVTIAGMDKLRGSFTAQTVGGRVEGGYRFTIRDYGVTPHATLQMLAYSAPNYGEKVVSGANDFALDFAARNTTQTRGEFGVRVDKRLNTRMPVLLRGRVAWVHEWMEAAKMSGSFQSLPGSDFEVIGASLSPDRILLSLGADVRLSQAFSLTAKADGEFATGATNLLGMVTLRYQW